MTQVKEFSSIWREFSFPPVLHWAAVVSLWIHYLLSGYKSEISNSLKSTLPQNYNTLFVYAINNFSNSLIMHEVINQLPGPIWVTWMPLYTPVRTDEITRLDIQTHVVGYPNTCVWKSISKNNEVLEQRFITFHDKSLFAVSIYVYIVVHAIYVYRAIREHC